MECLFCVFLGHDVVHLSFIFKFYGPALLSSTEDVGAKARVFAFPVGLPLFMLFLPRAQGEELSAGRYVHLVTARLVSWS